MNVIIKAKNLTKHYKHVQAVNGIEFIVHYDECFGFLGPNGAGKTTILKMIYCLSPKTSGELSVFDLNPEKDKSLIKSLIGVVPQEDSLDEELLVRDNLMIYAGFFGIKRKIARERIDNLLEFMDLQDKAKSKIRELSGGMKRRLVIIRALINNPKLLILDEPTTGLDPQVRHLIWGKLRELKQSGVTLLLTSHYMEEAAQLCDRLIILDKGKILMEGNPEELVMNNTKKYVLEFNYNGYETHSLAQLDDRIELEHYSDRYYLYCNEEKLLEEVSKNLNLEKKLIRNATLEDLFLKLTGRSLHE